VTTDERTHVSGRSWVPAAFAWGALLLGFVVAWRLSGTIHALESKIDAQARAGDEARADLSDDIKDIRRDVSTLVEASNGTVSKDMLRVWMARFALANPGVKVPEF
jgi:methyl-accepting chemotaxis protein